MKYRCISVHDSRKYRRAFLGEIQSQKIVVEFIPNWFEKLLGAKVELKTFWGAERDWFELESGHTVELELASFLEKIWINGFNPDLLNKP